ncbi:MAG: hypothetical protein A2622_06585 [Bdellovibrionales bacterium RIFCSPHIGHO2_01_FULL_40_29]|nr:MAG: hypothetical protein A2622_06585 [Bdellovibrionales bacterium RIFCSPHIGHO2_01_FULL_40_29]OFZ35109.1 MAG: hypothetical protein A3D17_06935 [Bdellovibrionales bacterium RIFCSPHIGHO2_02_FULL_40_15]
MNDGPSNISGLQKEWSLLVHSFLDQDIPDRKLVEKLNSQDLTLEQVNTLRKDLSQRRQGLNQKIETIKLEIERLSEIIESLSLVGSSIEETQTEIEALHQQGEKLSIEILSIDHKINKIHDLTDRLMKIPVFFEHTES